MSEFESCPRCGGDWEQYFPEIGCEVEHMYRGELECRRCAMIWFRSNNMLRLHFTADWYLFWHFERGDLGWYSRLHSLNGDTELPLLPYTATLEKVKVYLLFS